MEQQSEVIEQCVSNSGRKEAGARCHRRGKPPRTERESDQICYSSFVRILWCMTVIASSVRPEVEDPPVLGKQDNAVAARNHQGRA